MMQLKNELEQIIYSSKIMIEKWNGDNSVKFYNQGKLELAEFLLNKINTTDKNLKINYVISNLIEELSLYRFPNEIQNGTIYQAKNDLQNIKLRTNEDWDIYRVIFIKID